MTKGSLSSILLIITISITFTYKGYSNADIKIKKATTGGLLTFTIRTVTDNGTYSPKHVLAIWIEDANGFVKTRKAMANQRKQYLYTWKAASNYNVVDAITGPTLTSHQTHTVTWNCTDLSGNIVPDGDYTVWIEYTDKHAQGPLYNITFTKGPNAQSFIPADQTYFKDIQLDFIPYVSDFTSDVAEICQEETVTFTDLSIGATSWSWNFGSGAFPATATTVGPHIVTYTTSGSKTIYLTINGYVTETKQNMINVNPSPTADFSFSGNEYTVEFVNYSVNATSYLWDFGDGLTSIDDNPTHTYASAGTYPVTLTATYINCNDVISHDVSVPMVGISPAQLFNDPIIFYPNPVIDILYFQFNKNIVGDISINIFNSFGMLVIESIIKGGSENETKSLILKSLPKGIYYIKLDGTNLKTNKKIIIY